MAIPSAGGGMPPGGDAAAMAGGSSPQMQAMPGRVNTNNPEAIKTALRAAVQQAIDKSGFVDMNKLILLWPQIARQNGINVPFEAVLQMVQQNPEMIADLIAEMGLSGIRAGGKTYSAEQLAGMGTGAV